MMRVAKKRAARVMATVKRMATMMVKKRVRAAKAMVTRVVGNKEGDGHGGNLVRNNDNGLVPVVVQQAILYYSASTSLDDAGDAE